MKDTTEPEKENQIPSVEEVAMELGKTKSIDVFYINERIFSRLLSATIE